MKNFNAQSGSLPLRPRLTGIGLVATIFVVPIFLILIYRCVIEFPTYYWSCYPAEISKVEIKNSGSKSIYVTYQIKEFPGVDFNRVAPVAIDQDSPRPYYPIRYAKLIENNHQTEACIAPDGKSAILFSGFSEESGILFGIYLFLSSLFFYDWKRNSSK